MPQSPDGLPVPNGEMTASLLIVDDEQVNVSLLERIVRRAGYSDVRSTTDPNVVIKICRERLPDVILLDLHMPGLDGVAVMKQLAAEKFPLAPMVLILTGDVSTQAKTNALANGARDFLGKPFDIAEVLLRIRNLLELRAMHVQLMDTNQQLELKVRHRTADLEEARFDIINRLAKASEFRDDATGQHIHRVGAAAQNVARALGLPADDVEMIRHAAPLHDVGKIAIPDHVLLKPDALTHDERTVMQRHTTIGAQLLSNSRSPLLEYAREIALSHHERWDGAGYPRGLAGEEIPLTARIVALADFWDALTHARPYRVAVDPTIVRDMIIDGKGKHFDPNVVDAFMSVFPREASC